MSLNDIGDNSNKPELDGKTHINVYSRGVTELGKFLSNFTEAKIITEDGLFSSIEGYWYFLGSNSPDKDKFRKLHGVEAKKQGQADKDKTRINECDFKRKIKKAIAWKIGSNARMALAFMESTLPFVHYYDYKGRIIEVKDCDWIMEFLENLRKFMIENPLKVIHGSLFNSPKGSVLAHSCNLKGSWGAGVALEFAEKFPNAFKDHITRVKHGKFKLGQYHLINDSGYSILSLFTSVGFGADKSQPSTIHFNSFLSLFTYLTQNKEVKEVHIPRINSGLFRCKWSETEASLRLLKFLFNRTDIIIHIPKNQE